MLAGRYAVAVVVLALLLLPPAAVSIDPACDGTTYAANSTFQTNLNRLAAALRANASTSPAGFANATVGAAPDQVNGLALCRGDTNASTCAPCVAAAFKDAQQACHLSRGATIILDACVLRFAGSQFLDFLKADQWIVSELVYELSASRFFFFDKSILSPLKQICQLIYQSWDRHGRWERQRLGCLVHSRRHGNLHRPGWQRGGGDQLDEEVLLHRRDGLQSEDLRARSVHAAPDAGAVPGLPGVLTESGAADGRAVPVKRRCGGVVLPEVQRVAVLRGPGDTAACRAAGTTPGGHAFAWYSRVRNRLAQSLILLSL